MSSNSSSGDCGARYAPNAASTNANRGRDFPRDRNATSWKNCPVPIGRCTRHGKNCSINCRRIIRT